MLRREKGFTLIELLIVIAIIGILAAIAIPMYRAQTLKARLSEVTNSMSSVASAVATFYQENNTWAPNLANNTAIGNTLGVFVPTSRASWSLGGSPTTVQATVVGISANNPDLDGCTIQLIASTDAGGAINWTWGGTIGAAYRPTR